MTNMVAMKTGGARKLPGDSGSETEAVVYTFFHSETFIFSDGKSYRIEFKTSAALAPSALVGVEVYEGDSTTPFVLPLLATQLDLFVRTDTVLSLAQYEDEVWIATSDGDQYIRALKIFNGAISVINQFDLASTSNPFNWPMQLRPGITIALSNVTPNARDAVMTGGVWSDFIVNGEYIAIVGTALNAFTSTKEVFTNYYRVVSHSGANAVLDGTYQAGALDVLGIGTFTEIYTTAWGAVNGHPRVLGADDGRLIAASTPRKPSTIYGSFVGDQKHFNNIRQAYDRVDGNSYFGETLNTDPYIFTLASTRTSNIKFITSSRAMIIGTDEKIYVASGGDGIVGPLNIQIRPFDSRPASHLHVDVGDGVFYLTEDRLRAVLFDYNVDNGSFTSKEVSILSDDVYEDGDIDQLIYSEQHGIVFMKRGLGAELETSLTTVTISKDTGVVAHSTMTTPKPLINMALNELSGVVTLMYAYDGKVVHTSWDLSEQREDRVDFLKLAQTLTSGPPKLIWKYDNGEEGDEVCFVENDANGNVGFATLDAQKEFQTSEPINDVVVGFCYKSTVCPMSIEAGQQWGSAQMGVKRVDTVSTRFLKSFSYKIREVNSQFIEEQNLAQTTLTGVTPFTGAHEVKLSASPAREQIICVENERPEPFAVLGMSFRGLSNDG